MPAYDVVVVGGGAMGTAAAYQAARSAARVALVERFRPGHDRGSSHGRSRIFRLAYPDTQYIALAQRARALWRLLEDDAGTELLVQTGGVDHGPPSSVGPIAAALGDAGVRAELLPPTEAEQRWPGMRFDREVLFQPDAGRLDADATVSALHRRLGELDVHCYYDEPAQELRLTTRGVEVETGARVLRGTVAVVAAGAWAPGLLARQAFAAALPSFVVTQEQPAYFPVAEGTGWPSFIHYGAGRNGTSNGHVGYGLWTPGMGLKVGEHATGPAVDPDHRPPVDEARLGRLEAYVAEWLPGAVPRPTTVDRCLYTMTPDESFVVERHGAIVVCSPCSGHGFKFVPVIGEITARLALQE